MCRCYALSFSHSSPGARHVCAEANFEAPDIMKRLRATPTVRELLTHRMCEQEKMMLVLCCGVLGVYYKIKITGTEALLLLTTTEGTRTLFSNLVPESICMMFCAEFFAKTWIPGCLALFYKPSSMYQKDAILLRHIFPARSLLWFPGHLGTLPYSVSLAGKFQ